MTDPPVSITRCAPPGVPVPDRRPGAGTTVARTCAVRGCVPLRGTPSRRPPCRAVPFLAGRVAGIDAWLGAGCQARPRTVPGRLTGRAERWMPAVPGGRPARPPAGIRAGCLHPRQRRGRARGHRPGPPRARPLRPSPPAGPGTPRMAPPRRPTAGPFLFPPVPGPAAPGSRPPPQSLRGPDLTRRAERSVRRRGPTAGPPRETPTAPGRPPATPDQAPGTPGDPLLTIEEVTAELRVSRAAFYRWRRRSRAARRPAAGRRGAGPAQRADGVAAPTRRHARRTGAESKWTATTSGSGTSRSSAAAPQPATGSAGPSTGASTASRSRPAPSPTGSSTA